MVFRGVIIEESLCDKKILDRFNITDTKIEPVEQNHMTPWLTQWTLHDVYVDESDVLELSELLSENLEEDYWYADFKDEKSHYIIFNKKIFIVNKEDPSQYKPVVSYGLELGIPRYQLDFSPDISDWQR
ncbi:MAG: hypothetical protein U0R17_06205 [Acidimicrobiia bacterium]